MTQTQERPKLGGIPVMPVTQARQWIKAIIFGDPYSGKTHLAGSSSAVAEMSPVLFIDIEGGKETLRKTWPKCEVITVKPKVNMQGAEVKSAWEVLWDVCEDLKKYPPGKLPWRTIVLDNMSEGFILALQEAIDEAVLKAASRNRERSEDLAEPKDYNTAHSKFRKLARVYRDLNAHVIFTSWAREETNDSGVRKQLLPQLSGKLTKEITGYFSECWFLFVTDGSPDTDEDDDESTSTASERRLLVRERKKIKAKSRTDDMPDIIRNPTMRDLFDYIVGPSKAEKPETENRKPETAKRKETAK